MTDTQELWNYKVLILDEEPFIRDTLKLKLATQGIGTCTAESEKEAKKLLLSGKIDAVIIDILHSRISAYFFVQWLKGNPRTKEIPVIILTFKEKDPEMEFTYNVWADKYFTKPFSPREVVKKVAELVKDDRARLRKKMTHG